MPSQLELTDDASGITYVLTDEGMGRMVADGFAVTPDTPIRFGRPTVLLPLADGGGRAITTDKFLTYLTRKVN